MTEENHESREQLSQYPLLRALQGRRSRRFGRGMKIGGGPLAYESAHPPQPLSEAEEAALAFAACGITGHALADLDYGPGQGGSMLAGMVGRTIASPDTVNTVALIVTNDEATYLVKRPRDFSPAELADLILLSKADELTEIYRRSRIKIMDGRAAPPIEPVLNFDINKWSLYAKGGTYFIPINCMTEIYINVLLAVFDPESGLFARDERNFFRPAGVKRFGKKKGGTLDDSMTGGRLFTIQALESSLKESVSVEQGMMLQNLALMAQALGLGGFPNYARHPNCWFEALDFRMGKVPGTRFFGGPYWLSKIINWIGLQTFVPIPLGLERDGTALLKPYCPPYYSSMKEAVYALVEHKFGPQGVYRGAAQHNSGWQDPAGVTKQIAGPSDAAVDATVAYCEYVYKRYGHFPAFSAPFRTVIGYQATHVDTDFYDRFYKPEAITDSQRRHQDSWHAQKG